MVEKIVLTTALYNETIEDSCSSKNLAVPAVDFESVERLKAFLSKHATLNDHIFYFWLTNSTTNFYQYDSYRKNIYEKSGTIVKKSFVLCFDKGYSLSQKVGICLGILFGLAIFICTVMYIISRRNKTVSFGVNLLNINLINLVLKE